MRRRAGREIINIVNSIQRTSSIPFVEGRGPHKLPFIEKINPSRVKYVPGTGPNFSSRLRVLRGVDCEATLRLVLCFVAWWLIHQYGSCE